MPGITDLPTFNNENDLGSCASCLDTLKSINFFLSRTKKYHTPFPVILCTSAQLTSEGKFQFVQLSIANKRDYQH